MTVATRLLSAQTEPSRPADYTIDIAENEYAAYGNVGPILLMESAGWGPGHVALSVQWYRDGRAIAGAVAARYVPTRADLGHAITVEVTGREAGYATLSLSSVPHDVR